MNNKNHSRYYAHREKTYFPGKLYPQIRVGMQKVNLTPTVSVENGKRVLIPNEAVYIYDTGGPFSDSDKFIDIKQGIERIREEWILSRKDVMQLEEPTSVYCK